MDLSETQALPAAQRLTLAYLGRTEKEKLAPAFALDFRLSRIVGTASEPMLAQIRIAWWRDMLEKPVVDRPSGEAVLSGISKTWFERTNSLRALVDAWEELLLTERLNRETAEHIANSRASFLAEVMETPGGIANKECAQATAYRWALVDLAAHCSQDTERKLFVEIAMEIAPEPYSLPRNLRGIVVLDALARHALRNGGSPLASGRMAALVALRAGLLGR